MQRVKLIVKLMQLAKSQKLSFCVGHLHRIVHFQLLCCLDCFATKLIDLEVERQRNREQVHHVSDEDSFDFLKFCCD